MNPIPSMAAAIAYSDLNAKAHGYSGPADLWGHLGDKVSGEYRAMARAALTAYQDKVDSPAAAFAKTLDKHGDMLKRLAER